MKKMKDLVEFPKVSITSNGRMRTILGGERPKKKAEKGEDGPKEATLPFQRTRQRKNFIPVRERCGGKPENQNKKKKA